MPFAHVGGSLPAAAVCWCISLHVLWIAVQARLVALLREPVSRALSSVNMLFQCSPQFAQLRQGSAEYRQAWQAYVISELQRQLHVLSGCFAKVTASQAVHKQIDGCVRAGKNKTAG
jgi:hypothetical protein